jgi:hypothetical protein
MILTHTPTLTRFAVMGVAKIAGLRVKDPTERLNRFEADIFEDDEDDEDLDLSV